MKLLPKLRKPSSQVFNNELGSPYDFGYPKITKEQEINLVASLFEHLMIFDRIIISTSRLNFALFFLITRLGINTVERMLDNGYLKFLLWTPVIVTAGGTQREDGTIDKSTIMGKPPIVAGSLTEKDFDPENNVNNALSQLEMNRERRRIIIKRAAKNYIIPNGMEFSSESAKTVIEAYENNNLAYLDLPFSKEANQMDFEDRRTLMHLGHKVLEIALLSKYDLKSYENYDHYAITKQNVDNIGKAYNVQENTNTLLSMHNLPNLKELFIQNHFDFDSAFNLRNTSNAKYYRKWINHVSENIDATEISKEYLNEISGNNRFFETTGGKFLKTLGSFGIGTALGAALAGTGAAAVAGLTFGLLESLWLDNILKGKNPSIFIKEIERELRREKD